MKVSKKQMFAGALASSVLGLSLLVPGVAMANAANTDTAMSTFVQKLAIKLGVDESKVKSAFTEVHDYIKSEKDAEYKTKLADAVESGKLTQRQADILTALLDIKPEEPSEDTKPQDLSNLTEDERKARMEKIRTKMLEEIVTKLNEKGLNTNAEEVKAAQETARSAGLKGGFVMGKRHGGPGMMF